MRTARTTTNLNGHDSNLRDVGMVAVDANNQAAGVIVLWKLEGDIDSTALAKVWAQANLDDRLLIRPPSPRSAFRRAVKGLEDKHRLVREIDGDFLVVDEIRRGDTLTWVPQARVRLTPGNIIDVSGGSDEADPAAIEPIYNAVMTAHLYHASTITAHDVSGWLCQIVELCHAVPLREGGGVYFVPRPHLPRWEAMVGALRSVSQHRVYGIPALPTDEAVAAILDALTTEVQDQVAKIQRDIDAGDLGERAKQTRLARADVMESKLGGFEALFGRKLEGLRDQVERLRAHLTIAKLSQLDLEVTS